VEGQLRGLITHYLNCSFSLNNHNLCVTFSLCKAFPLVLFQQYAEKFWKTSKQDIGLKIGNQDVYTDKWWSWDSSLGLSKSMFTAQHCKCFEEQIVCLTRLRRKIMVSMGFFAAVGFEFKACVSSMVFLMQLRPPACTIMPSLFVEMKGRISLFLPRHTLIHDPPVSAS
jgi:hypothetical protein